MACSAPLAAGAAPKTAGALSVKTRTAPNETAALDIVLSNVTQQNNRRIV
jgi:hypothetical protein